MNNVAIVGCIAVVVYAGIILGIALRSSRNKDTVSTGKKFFLGSGLGVIVLLFSMMASSFSTWVIMGAPVTTYTTGMTWVMLVTLYQMTMAFSCGYLGPRFWRLRRARDYVTQGDLVADYFKDNKIRYLMGTGFVLGMFASCVAQFRAMGTAISTMTDGVIPYWAATLFLFAVIAVYVCIGGFTGSALVDTFQGMLFTFVLWGGFAVVLVKLGGLGNLFDEVAAVDTRLILYGDNSPDSLWPPVAAITFCLTTCFGGGFTPGFWQRYYAADNPQTLKKMSVWFPILVSLGVTTSGGLVGLAAHAFEARGITISNPSSVFQLLLSAISTPYWSVFVVIAVLAAGMSTVAGYMNGSAMILTYDFIHTFRPNIDDVKLRDRGRIIMVAMMALAYLLSQFTTSAVTALIALAVAFYAVALYPVITIFIWKRGTYAGCLAASVGSLCAVIVTNFILKNPLGVHSGVWGLMVGFSLYFLVSLATKPIPAEQRAAYLEPLRKTKVYERTYTD